MKLAKNEKQARKNFKIKLQEVGGVIVQFNGVTVVCMPSVQGENVRFARAAVSICSDKDKYSRKRGELVALDNWWLHSRTIPLSLPYGTACVMSTKEKLIYAANNLAEFLAD